MQTTNSHAATIARLQAAKDAADASHAQMQRDMREQMERLRTQYQFRVCELTPSNCELPADSFLAERVRNVDP
jgi:hypothetical protein